MLLNVIFIRASFFINILLIWIFQVNISLLHAEKCDRWSFVMISFYPSNQNNTTHTGARQIRKWELLLIVHGSWFVVRCPSEHSSRLHDILCYTGTTGPFLQLRSGQALSYVEDVPAKLNTVRCTLNAVRYIYDQSF